MLYNGANVYTSAIHKYVIQCSVASPEALPIGSVDYVVQNEI